MAKKTHLLIIDPQVDFCSPNGRLYVGGAENDTTRLAKFIKANTKRLDWLHITQDSHHRTHIANCVNWVDASGKDAPPFTFVSVSDVKNGVWRAKNPRRQAWFESYVNKLATNNRYPLCLWPPHCIIGTPGHGFMPEIAEAMEQWEDDNSRASNIVTKGSADDTEHYSAVQADVAIDAIPSTKLNVRLIEVLKTVDELLIAGEALSHCVANTVTDIADAFGDDSLVRKFVLLTDASSPVGIDPCPQMAKAFVDKMTKRGMRLSTTVSYF